MNIKNLLKFSYKKHRHISYDSGTTNGTNQNWHANNNKAEVVNNISRDILRARARDLERNSDFIKSILLANNRNVVGNGIKLSAKTDDEEFNNKIENIWTEWCKLKNCEITQSWCFTEILQIIIRRMKVDGGILIYKIYDNSKYGIKLQIKEVDDLDNTLTSFNGNIVINGIELNSYGETIAYHLKTYSNLGFYTGNSQRITADKIIYLLKKDRPSQTREVSEFASTISGIRDIQSFDEAVSIKERILACLSIFIKKKGVGGIGRANSINNNESQEAQISPGMINYLEPGDDIQVVNPNGQAQNASEYISTKQRIIGAGQGLSYESVSRDMSKSNYSSARQGMIEDKSTYSDMQHYLIEHFCDIIYIDFVNIAILKGLVTAKDYINNPEKYYKAKWVANGMLWIDPLKEVRANEVAIETNQTTLEIVAANQGQDYKEILEQRAKEKNFIKELEEKDNNKSIGEEQTISQVSLNGAQISSLLEIVQSVVSNLLEYDSAIILITTAFPIDDETAKKILGNTEKLSSNE